MTKAKAMMRRNWQLRLAGQAGASVAARRLPQLLEDEPLWVVSGPAQRRLHRAGAAVV